MPNSIGAAGLTTATQSELATSFTNSLKSLYGSDINLDSSTPDGQLTMTFIQVILDMLDLINQVNAQFDPDQAMGVLLDQRVSLNGIKRQAGTYTITPISITTTQALTLTGIDTSPSNPYTVSDNAGNKWQLITTQAIASAGTYSLNFQSEKPGAVFTTINTINIAASVVLGVTTINNPTTYSVLGLEEEKDSELKIRRQKSVALSSQGYLKGLQAALANINGLTSAFVHENTSATTDVDGIPGHSIWVIVQGGAAADIATAIYSKRNAGCGMRGSQSYTLTQLDGSPFIVNWDVVTPQNLYIQFSASSLDGINPPNVAAIKAGLLTSFVPGVYEKVNINDLATEVQKIDSNTLVTNAGFCTTVNGTYLSTLTPSSKNLQFILSSSNIAVTVVP